MAEVKTLAPYDVRAIRRDFPILNQKMNGKPLVYLDNAATSQKPTAVIQAVKEFYQRYNANVHRGIYKISEEATAAYEGARQKVARFINARSPREIIFVRNATEAINLVAYAWGRLHVYEGDEILLTEMEHHSNIVPWQLLAQEADATVKYLPIDEQGLLRLDLLDGYLTERTRLVAVTTMSNVLGTINPVGEIIRRAHARGILMLVDGAQGVSHTPVDVQALDCDFLAFTGHKMLGPTGIGMLYGKRELLEAMDPFLSGGEMIREVRFEGATWKEVPWKFEAGTPAIAQAIGLGAAINYLQGIGMQAIHSYEQELIGYALARLQEVEGIRVYGPPADQRGGLVAFNLGTIHAHDLATILDYEGIAVRAGHHCAMPLHSRLGAVATARASVYLYNLPEEIDRLVEGLNKAAEVFGQ